ncbi:MAG: glycosyltransferase family 1 protein [Oscillospiraceae bacterium]|nr:glycosyltransferase family 1 protein [Oscillospiraceae bacterium]
MIRILQMIGSLNVGGSQTMILNIYRNIDRSRIQFDFVLDHPDETYFAEDVKALGARIYTMPVFRGTNAGEIRRDWNNFFYTHPEYRVLHSHVRSYASLYLPVARQHGVKTIIHSHNTSNGSGMTAMVKNALQRPLRDQADILMACSTEAGEWLYGKKACQSDRFVFLPNAVDTRRFRPDEQRRRAARRELGLDGRLVIGHVGRFNEQKNHGFLLEAFKLVHDRNPRAALLLVGEGPLQLEMAQKAVDLGIAEDVIMTGNRNDVPELLAAMDVFAFPSLFEGLPVTLIEAQAAGLPCVISDAITRDVDISPLIERLPIDSAEAWADALLEKREHRDVTRDIVRAGFDVQASTQRISELYTRLDRQAREDAR